MDDHFDSYQHQVQIPIGAPLFRCDPFAHVVSNSQKGLICDGCFKGLANCEKVICLKCQKFYYCSQECCVKDAPVHQIECAYDLLTKLESRFNNDKFKCEMPKLFLPFDDLMDYTRLMFRTLQAALIDKEQSTSHSQPMETDQDNVLYRFFHGITWNQVGIDFRFNLEEDESEELVNKYLEDYENMTEQERLDLDSKLGFEIPGQDFFRNIVVQDETKIVLNQVLDKVCDRFSTDYFDAFLTPQGDLVIADESVTSQKTLHSFIERLGLSSSDDILSKVSSETLYEYYIEELKEHRLWEKIIALPYDKKMETMIQGFESFKLNFVSQCYESSCGNSQVRRRTDDTYLELTNRLDHYLSIENITNQPVSEETEMDSLKMMYRMHLLSLRFNELASQIKSPITATYGFWIKAIKSVLNQMGFRKILNNSWSQLLKVFYLNLRYSVAVPDVIYSWPIGRAIYLPLTRLSHSCLPNSSAVFDGKTLQLAYLPSKAITTKPAEGFFQKLTYDPVSGCIYDPNLGVYSEASSSIVHYLPLWKSLSLSSITFDFQHELLSREEPVNLYMLNQVRRIDCHCERCAEIKSIQEANKNEKNDEPSSYLDNDLFMDDDDEPWYFNEEDDSNLHKYNNCLSIVEQLNVQYGNYRDYEYALKIQVPVNELIQLYRQLLGYYHPKISMLEFFLLYANLILTQEQRDPCNIFYHFKFVHHYLLQTLDSLAITHGHQHSYMEILDKLHQFVHSKLAHFYQLGRQIIGRIEQFDSKRKVWPVELFLQLANCHKIARLCSKVKDTDDLHMAQINAISPFLLQNNELIETGDCSSDYNSPSFKKARYLDHEQNPVIKNALLETDNNYLINQSNKLDMSTAFQLMKNICEFSDFRKF